MAMIATVRLLASGWSSWAFHCASVLPPKVVGVAGVGESFCEGPCDRGGRAVAERTTARMNKTVADTARMGTPLSVLLPLTPRIPEGPGAGQRGMGVKRGRVGEL